MMPSRSRNPGQSKFTCHLQTAERALRRSWQATEPEEREGAADQQDQQAGPGEDRGDLRPLRPEYNLRAKVLVDPLQFLLVLGVEVGAVGGLRDLLERLLVE